MIKCQLTFDNNAAVDSEVMMVLNTHYCICSCCTELHMVSLSQVDCHF